MIKMLEQNQPTSCLNKSQEDEPLFVLCARDLSAPGVVRLWAARAEMAGARPEKIASALECAEQMEAWQKAHPDLAKRPS